MAAIIPIDDPADDRLRQYVDIRQARVASSSAASDHFIAEGRLVVQRLIESDYEVDSLLVQAGKEEPLLSMLPGSVSVYTMSRDQINQVVGFDFHRGVLACGLRRQSASIEHFCQHESPSSQVALGLLGISDQENMGSMLRTAAALGINQILLGPTSIDPFNRRVIRVSMATVFKHQFYQMRDDVRDLHAIAAADVHTVASTLDPGAPTLKDFRRDHRRLLLLVGNEAQGISEQVQSMVDARVRIPMELGTDSLNVATAAAILMYELKGRA